MSEYENEQGTGGFCGRQSAARVLWVEGERHERMAKALRMLGNMVNDFPTPEDGAEDPIEPLLWELLVRANWR